MTQLGIGMLRSEIATAKGIAAHRQDPADVRSLQQYPAGIGS